VSTVNRVGPYVYVSLSIFMLNGFIRLDTTFKCTKKSVGDSEPGNFRFFRRDDTFTVSFLVVLGTAYFPITRAELTNNIEAFVEPTQHS
jgi:hypothetical protein